MSDEALLTLRQLADELKLPESTVRYYRDSFLDHIPSVGTGRRRRYPREAVAVLRSIAKSYAGGRSRSEIVSGINGHGTTAPVAALTETQVRTVPLEDVTNLDLLAAILDGEREQRDALWQMAKEILRLTEVLEGQDKVLNEIADRAGVIVTTTPATLRTAAPRASLSAPAPAPAAAPAAAPSLVPAFSPTPIFGSADSSAFFASPPAASPPPFSTSPTGPMPAMDFPDLPMAERNDATADAAASGAPPVETPFATEPAEGELPVIGRFTASPGTDMERLKAELESERALVERLREAKLQLEHRAADAEAALEERHGRKGGVIRRLLGSE